MKITKLIVGVASIVAGSAAFAGNFTTNSPSGSPGSVLVYQVSFAGDGATEDAQLDASYTAANFTSVTATVVVPGSTCTTPGGNSIRVVPPSGAGVALTSTPTIYCSFNFTTQPAAVPPQSYSLTVIPPLVCADSVGPVFDNPCTATLGTLNIAAGPAVGPTITYTPATGGTVTFPAATSIGGTTTQAITLVGAGGQNGGTTVLSACSSTVGNITFTDGANTCTAGGACVDGALNLQCVSTSNPQSGTATCTETRQNETVSGDGITAVNPRTWNVSCPAANVAPALGYVPAPGPITMPTVGQGQTANSSIAVTPSNGSGTGTSTVSNCAFSAQVGATFTAPVGTLTFNGSGVTPQNLNFSCVAPTNGSADGTATLTCSEDIGGTITPRVWTPVTCPDGLPVAAPNVDYSQVGGTTITFPAGASVGSSVPGSISIDIDINGGAPGGGAGPETASVSCSATAGFTVAGGTAGPVAAVAPSGTDTTAVVSCTSAASAQAGTLTCVASQVIDGGAPTTANTTYPLDCAAAEVNITSAPPAGPISLAGAPLTNVAGSIVLSNSGSDSTLGCTASGDVTLGAVPGTVPSAGSATVPYTCLTGAAGVAGTGQIVCLTQDPGAEATLTYDISCVGLSDVPVPAINNFGKLLMVVLVIGLGLVGLGARRQ